MLGRSLTLALMGLSALTQALPTKSESKAAVSARQEDIFILGGSLPSDETIAIEALEITLEALQDLPHKNHTVAEEIGALKAILYYLYDITSITAPDGTTTTITISSRQDTFTIGSTLPADDATAIGELEVEQAALEALATKTYDDWELIGAIEALLYYKYNAVDEFTLLGSTTTLTISKRDTFTLGSPLPSSEAAAIAELEITLEELQDLSTKTYADWEIIGAIKALLYYTYHITSITAPSGTTTTLTIGKRDTFTIGDSLPSSSAAAIAELEVELEELEDLTTKTSADWQLIGAIKALLYYTYHITSISAPSGVISTLTVGKRQTGVFEILPGTTSTFTVGKREDDSATKRQDDVFEILPGTTSTLTIGKRQSGIFEILPGTTSTLTIGKRDDDTAAKRQDDVFEILPGTTSTLTVGKRDDDATAKRQDDIFEILPGTTSTLTIGKRQSGVFEILPGASTTLTVGKRQSGVFEILPGTTSTLTIGKRDDDSATKRQDDVFEILPGTTSTLTIGKRQSEIIEVLPGASSTFTIGKRKEIDSVVTATRTVPKRQSDVFEIIGVIPTGEAAAITYLEDKLISLLAVSNKTTVQLEAIADIEELLYYEYDISSIELPDGSTTVFTIGKRQSDVFEIIGVIPTGEAAAIAYLEDKLISLLAISNKTTVQLEAIADIEELLYYEYDISSIELPDGSTTVFTIGKRQSSVFEIIGSIPSGETAAIAYLEKKLESLLDLSDPTAVQLEAITDIEELLYYEYGITSITAPDGTTTTFTIGKH